MSRFSVPSLARTGWEVLTSPRRFGALLDAEEGIGRAVLFFFVCAASASAIDLVATAVLHGRPMMGAMPFMLVRLVLLMGLVPFIGGGILYGVCWIGGSKLLIETGLHIAAYAVGAVLPLAAVLRQHPTRGVVAAGAALAYGLLLVIAGARLTWGGRPELAAPSPLRPAGEPAQDEAPVSRMAGAGSSGG